MTSSQALSAADYGSKLHRIIAILKKRFPNLKVEEAVKLATDILTSLEAE